MRLPLGPLCLECEGRGVVDIVATSDDRLSPERTFIPLDSLGVDLATIDLDSLVVTVDGAVATGWFHEDGVLYFDAPLRSSATAEVDFDVYLDCE